jgi:hypothetical protein
MLHADFLHNLVKHLYCIDTAVPFPMYGPNFRKIIKMKCYMLHLLHLEAHNLT